MSDWMDIETAPKDGTLVLVYCREESVTSLHGNIAVARHAHDVEWEDGAPMSQWEYGEYDTPHATSGKGGYVVTATHWMPLPEPPK